ncbi:MAG: PilN domain-containing protein [Candidatus Acidulodesulfobacterium sp.]
MKTGKNKPIEKTRINLLPAKNKEIIAKNRKKLLFASVIAGYVIFIFLIDASLVLINNAKNKYIEVLSQKLTVMQTKNIMNNAFETAINKRKLLLNDIDKKVSLIENLKKLKVSWYGKIDKIVAASPKGVWMSSVSLKDGKVSIEGNSVSLNNISVYTNNMKATTLFEKMTLVGINIKKVNGNTFYGFKIIGLLNGIPDMNIQNMADVAKKK